MATKTILPDGFPILIPYQHHSVYFVCFFTLRFPVKSNDLLALILSWSSLGLPVLAELGHKSAGMS
jgi:hypothetical protein